MKQHVIHKLFNTVTASAEWLDHLVGNALESGEIVEHIDDFQIVPVPPASEGYVVVAVVTVRATA